VPRKDRQSGAKAPPPGDAEERARQDEALRRATEQLEVLEEQFADLYEYAPVGYATVDEKGVIHRVNMAGAALLGAAHPEVVGKRLPTFVRPESRTACASFLRNAFMATAPTSCEVALTAEKWRASFLQLIASPAATGRDLGHAGPQARIALVDITDRRHAEEALQESRSLHDAVVSTMAEGVVVHDARGGIVSANTAAERILGLDADEIRGRRPVDPHWQVIREDGSPLRGEEHPAMVALRTGIAQWNQVLGIRMPDETLTWIGVTAEPIRSRDGTVRGVVATFSDITEARRREAELRESRERLTQVLDASSDGFWEWDVASGRIRFSAHLSAILGGPAVESEWDVESWPDRVDEAQREEMRHRVAAVAAGGVDRIDAEYRVRVTGGAWKWLRATGRAVAHGADGRVIRLAGAVSDVTAHKEFGERLRRSEALHRAIAGNIPGAAVFLFDRNLRCVLAEGPALAREGIDRLAIEGMPVDAVALPGGKRLDEARIREAFAGKSSDVELPLGERIYSMRVGPVLDAEGKPFLAAATAVDVTQLKSVEQQLRRSNESLERRYHLLASNARDIMLILRASDGRILEANDAAVESYGYPRGELLRMSARELRAPESMPSLDAQLGAAAGDGAKYEALQRRKDGTTFWAEVVARGVDLDGERVIVGVGRDVTDRKREAQAAQARLAALGAQVGGATQGIEAALARQMESARRAIGELRELSGLLAGKRGLEPKELVGRVDEALEDLEAARSQAQRIARVVAELAAVAELPPATAPAPRGAPAGGPRPSSGCDTADT
jgi:PAS domain S-box-containing protein